MTACVSPWKRCCGSLNFARPRNGAKSLPLNELACRVHVASRKGYRAAFDERTTTRPRVSPSTRVGAPQSRILAKRLTGTKQEAWRFRVGDHRVITQFQDSRLVVLVVEIGNRREIYR
ncbi:type II toxin-antitoxin system RelE/ParE family toxin [Mesorhizobium sp. M0152]|uniref:type II toxin-antitoxin system RelE family toxin n=1 Tax=Mesorhizobium sp. M0152 TaxID=2956898 RepID=UPI0033368185